MIKSQLAAFVSIISIFFVAILLLFLNLIQPKIYVARVARYYILNEKIVNQENLNSLLDSRWNLNSSQRLIDYLAGWKYSCIQNDSLSKKYYKELLQNVSERLSEFKIYTGFSYNLTWIGPKCPNERIFEIFIDNGSPIVICIPKVKT